MHGTTGHSGPVVPGTRENKEVIWGRGKWNLAVPLLLHSTPTPLPVSLDAWSSPAAALASLDRVFPSRSAPTKLLPFSISSNGPWYLPPFPLVSHIFLDPLHGCGLVVKAWIFIKSMSWRSNISG